MGLCVGIYIYINGPEIFVGNFIHQMCTRVIILFVCYIIIDLIPISIQLFRYYTFLLSYCVFLIDHTYHIDRIKERVRYNLIPTVVIYLCKNVSEDRIYMAMEFSRGSIYMYVWLVIVCLISVPINTVPLSRYCYILLYY